jgi:hypothetical protein
MGLEMGARELTQTWFRPLLSLSRSLPPDPPSLPTYLSLSLSVSLSLSLSLSLSRVRLMHPLPALGVDEEEVYLESIKVDGAENVQLVALPSKRVREMK